MKKIICTAKQQRYIKLFCALVLGLLLSFFVSSIVPAHSSVLAQHIPNQRQLSALEQQEQQARALYKEQQFSRAISLWQAIAQRYAEQSDKLSQASALSNLALSYQSLGQWTNAQEALSESLNIIAELPDTPATQPVLAQALMTAGSLYLETGEIERALETWQRAASIYDQIGDTFGKSRAQINQAQALRELGFYGRSLQQLQEVAADVENESPLRAAEVQTTELKAVALRRLGNALRLSGQLVQAESVLTQSLVAAEQLDNPAEISAALLSLGRVALGRENFSAAEARYEQALETVTHSRLENSLAIPIQLAQLSLYIESENWAAAAVVWPLIQAQFLQTAPSRTNIYHRINWADSLLQFFRTARATTENQSLAEKRPDIEQIAQQLQQAIEQAREIEDTRAEAYGLGLLGQVYEQTQQWSEAIQLTQRALILSDQIQATDILYQWQWQLGKLWNHPNNPERSVDSAIASYAQAVETLSQLRGDLAAADAQFSFEKKVEPVYREMIALLLQTDTQAANYSQNIARAQTVIEDLRIAELDNFFKEACADVQPVDATQIDPNAAIVYTVVLKDRLSIILNLPNQPPQHIAIAISERDVSELATKLRQDLVIRSRRNYFTTAKQAYDLLIAPIRTALDGSGVDTIVYVPDGPLRAVPLAALYDGDRFLIEDYAVGLTPSLALMNPNQWLAQGPLHRQRTLIAGLTESRAGFSSLPYVEKEIRSIAQTISNNKVLLNEDFTQDALAKRLKNKAHPIVHIATHGKFGATPEETYLLTWDGQINVREIDQMLQANLGNREGIELLMLSACESASTDPKAGLGLAGVAIKAGANSTIGTIWSIDDEAAAHFVDIFYQELTQPNATRASTLRKAQIALLKDPQYQHPIYWAAYVMLGSWL